MEGRIDIHFKYKGATYKVELFTKIEVVHFTKNGVPFQVIPLSVLKERAALAQNDSNLYYLAYDNLIGITEKVDELMTKQ